MAKKKSHMIKCQIYCKLWYGSSEHRINLISTQATWLSFIQWQDDMAAMAVASFDILTEFRSFFIFAYYWNWNTPKIHSWQWRLKIPWFNRCAPKLVQTPSQATHTHTHTAAHHFFQFTFYWHLLLSNQFRRHELSIRALPFPKACIYLVRISTTKQRERNEKKKWTKK